MFVFPFQPSAYFLSTPFLPYFIFTITLHSWLFPSFLTSPSTFYFRYSCSFHIIQQHWNEPFDESGRLFVPAQLVSLVQNCSQHQLQNSRKENGWSSPVIFRPANWMMTAHHLHYKTQQIIYFKIVAWIFNSPNHQTLAAAGIIVSTAADCDKVTRCWSSSSKLG